MLSQRWLALVSGMLVLLAATVARAGEPPTDPLLDNVSREVSSYLEQISDVRCTEHVLQMKLDAKGHTEYHEDATYDYLVLLDGSGDRMLFNESRLPQGLHHPTPKNVPMLITNGFSDLFLIFHPYYRNSFIFSRQPDEVLDGQHMFVFTFQHIPGMRTPAAIAVRGRQFPLELGGRAWIDATTGMVARIEAHVSKDMTDVGLRSMDTDVYYAPVQLPGWPQPYRFPSKASVEVQTLRQRWRNVHQFTNYQRFTVETQVDVAKNNSKDPNKP
jgi:hypothetical protein